MKSKLHDISFGALCLIVSVVSSTSWAETLENGSDSQLRLGFGVDPVTSQVLEKCIDDQNGGVEAADSRPGTTSPTGSFRLPFSVSQITSYEEMDRFMMTDISAKVSSTFASGEFNYSGLNNKALYSDRAAIGIDASADYGRWYLKHTKLTPEAAALAIADRKKFFEKCGTDTISGYRLGQGLKVTMMTSAQTAISYESMRMSMNASVNAGTTSGDVAAAVMSAASNLLKVGSLQITFKAYGGGDIGSISSLINSEADAASFRQQISQYVGAMSPDKAVITHFITTPYFSDSETYDPLLTKHKRTVVRQLYSDYRLLYDNQERLNKALRGGRLQTYLREACVKDRPKCDEYIRSMSFHQQEITMRLERIRQDVKKCVGGTRISDCVTRAEDHWEVSALSQIIWPAAFRHSLLKSLLDDVIDG